jgi:hypothetical protein
MQGACLQTDKLLWSPNQIVILDAVSHYSAQDYSAHALREVLDKATTIFQGASCISDRGVAQFHLKIGFMPQKLAIPCTTWEAKGSELQLPHFLLVLFQR